MSDAPAAKGALAGLRVVDFGEMVSAPYAAKLMADLGADVIKVETPAGDRARSRGPFPKGRDGDHEASGLYLYLNANKRGVMLDTGTPGGRDEFLRLLASADVLIHNRSLGETEAARLDYESVHGDLPDLIYTWVTPFGIRGPRARWNAENLTVISAGGWASITPGNSPYDDEPPLQAFGHQGDFQAAGSAAVATMGALFARKRSGRGQLVEVSAQECIAAALELGLVNYTYAGRVASRLGVRTSAPMEIMECSDGLIFVMTADPHQWDAFVKMMGDPDWASWEVFDDRFKRGENRDALRPLLGEWLAEHTVREVFDMAGAARLPFAPVSTISDLVDSPHLNARGFFATMNQPGVGDLTVPGAPYLMPDTPWELRSPAPRLGEHNDEVLDDLRAEAKR